MKAATLCLIVLAFAGQPADDPPRPVPVPTLPFDPLPPRPPSGPAIPF